MYLKSIQMIRASLCLPSRKSKPEIPILYYLQKKSKEVIQNTQYKKSHNNKATHLETTVYRGW